MDKQDDILFLAAAILYASGISLLLALWALEPSLR